MAERHRRYCMLVKRIQKFIIAAAQNAKEKFDELEEVKKKSGVRKREN